MGVTGSRRWLSEGETIAGRDIDMRGLRWHKPVPIHYSPQLIIVIRVGRSREPRLRSLFIAQDKYLMRARIYGCDMIENLLCWGLSVFLLKHKSLFLEIITIKVNLPFFSGAFIGIPWFLLVNRFSELSFSNS